MEEKRSKIIDLLVAIHVENMSIISKIYGDGIVKMYEKEFGEVINNKNSNNKEILAVREELLKRGDLYYGFKSSILSAIRENFDKVTANGVGIEVIATVKDESEIAEKILDRIIGE